MSNESILAIIRPAYSETDRAILDDMALERAVIRARQEFGYDLLSADAIKRAAQSGLDKARLWDLEYKLKFAIRMLEAQNG